MRNENQMTAPITPKPSLEELARRGHDALYGTTRLDIHPSSPVPVADKQQWDEYGDCEACGCAIETRAAELPCIHTSELLEELVQRRAQDLYGAFQAAASAKSIKECIAIERAKITVPVAEGQTDEGLWIAAESAGCRSEIRTMKGRWIGYAYNEDEARKIVNAHNAAIKSAEAVKDADSLTQWTPLRKAILAPANCGVTGHFKFQENGGHCIMCQREQQRGRVAWEAGAKLARGYGDNICHFEGE